MLFRVEPLMEQWLPEFGAGFHTEQWLPYEGRYFSIGMCYPPSPLDHTTEIPEHLQHHIK